MGSRYAVDNDEGAFNAYYERPATISLIEPVDGLRVLEVGCGGGHLTEWLVERGADVTAFDVSPVMLRLARRRVGDRATFLLADASAPLEFAADNSFDLVVASLVLHYIADWRPVLREFRRVLRSDGAVVCSTHHPTMDWEIGGGDYFDSRLITQTWRKGGRDFDVTFWRRPLTAITDAVSESGFLIERLVEPRPSDVLRSRDLEVYELLISEPMFLFFRLKPSVRHS